MSTLLCLLFGSIAGLALGLTGGGGSVFSVPMLVYGLNVPAHEAVGISLAAVGATAFFGFVQLWRRREVEFGAGLLFAALGVAGAPLGSWLNSLIPGAVLLIAFGGLMFIVAAWMWIKATRQPQEAAVVRAAIHAPPEEAHGPACQRDPKGRLRLTSRCAGILAVLGAVTGFPPRLSRLG